LIVVVPKERIETARELVRGAPRAVVVAGGDTRRESVARGLERVGDAGRLVVHDAARPFVTSSLLGRVLDGLRGHDGAIAAEPVEETLKAVDDERVVETVDRSRLWRAQTPQAFTTDALRRAHAASPEIAATDDAQLVELAGGRVAVVRGDRHNVKITYDEDFVLAESLAASRS
jgi:2-C-methyl-D-erythritol 4-phosphate cytidylyltransferase